MVLYYYSTTIQLNNVLSDGIQSCHSICLIPNHAVLVEIRISLFLFTV